MVTEEDGTRVHAPQKLLRPKDVHAEYGISMNEIYKAIHEGKLKVHRPDGTSRGYWIKQDSLADWLEHRMKEVN